MDKNNKNYIPFNGKKYMIDIEALKRICLISSDQNGKETEVTEGYDVREEDGSLSLTSKILREVKSTGNPQNDMIIYDIIKAFIVRLLENDYTEIDFINKLDFSTVLSFNTLVECGLLVEIE